MPSAAPDLSHLSDEQLQAILNGGKPAPAARPAASAPPAFSDLSDAQLQALADQGAPPDGQFNQDRFLRNQGDEGPDSAPLRQGLLKTARDISMGKQLGRQRPTATEASGFGLIHTLPWDDEIAGAVGGTFDYANDWWHDRPTSLSDRYNAARNEYNLKGDDAWQDHPYAYGAGMAGGFIGQALMAPEVEALSLPGTSLALRPAGTVGKAALNGGVYGALYGSGEGDGVLDRLGHAGFGALGGTVLGGIGGKAVDYFEQRALSRTMDEIRKAAAERAAHADSDAAGIDLSYGQLTGDIPAQTYENKVINGAYGPKAQEVGVNHIENFKTQVGQSINAANELIAGHDAGGVPHVQINVPNEAGEALIPSITRTAQTGQAAVDAANAADVAMARGAADSVTRGLGGGRAPSDLYGVAEDVGAGTRSREAASRGDYNSRYQTAGQVQATVDATPLRNLGQRLRGMLMRSADPVVVDPQLTPNASHALDYLDDVGNFVAPVNQVAGMPPPSSVTGVTAQGLEHVRKVLNTLLDGAYDATKQGGGADYRAVTAIKNAYDAHLQDIYHQGLFTGDPSWLSAWQQARAAFAQHQRLFRPDDDLRQSVRRIIENQATPEEVIRYMYGRAMTGDSRQSAALADHLRTILGDTSDEWGAIRQGGWQHLIGTANQNQQITHETAQAIADRIDQFLTNRGRTLAQTLYSDPERQQMANFAQGLRQMATNRRTPPAALQHMIDLASGRPLQAEALANTLVGGSGSTILKAPESNRLIDNLLALHGPDSQEVSLVKQAIWRKATSTAEGQRNLSPGQIAENISALLNGTGRPVSQRLFSQAERDQMGAIARTLRRSIPDPKAVNGSNSGNRLLGALQEQATKMIGTLTMILGGTPQHIVANMAVSHGAAAVNSARNAGKAARSFAGKPPRSATKWAGRQIGTGLLKSLGMATDQAGTISGKGSVPAIAYGQRKLLAAPAPTDPQSDPVAPGGPMQ